MGRLEGILNDLMSIGQRRPLTGKAKTVAKVLAFALPLFVFYDIGSSYLLPPMSTGMSRGLFLILGACLIFMLHPFGKNSPSDTTPWYDYLFILVTLTTFGYYAINFIALQQRSGDPTQLDVVMGLLAIVISLETTRRVMGPALFGLGVFALLYMLFGDKLPLSMFSHQGFALATISDSAYSLNGIFGFILNITMDYVVMFVLVGSMLQAFGAGTFFIELPWAIFSRWRGGPGMSAVGASALFGTISGSAAANTAATGTFTIPLMKRAGYPSHVAGAIEPAASTGGMFMPPIMGVGAFIMAELTHTPYITIAIVGLVPALIYFFSVLCFCYTEAGKHGITTVPKKERPAVMPILKRGWFYIIPIIILTVMLIQQYTPPLAAMMAVISTIVINIFVRIVTKDKATTYLQVGRGIVKSLSTALQDTANGSLLIVSLVGTIGIIVAVIFVTGVGFMFTSSMVQMTQGNLLMALLVALVVSYILGMGMTVTTVYVLLAILLAPAMGQMGVPLLGVHFLLFWWSQTSNISPPVAVAAYIGAGIARADPIKTAFTCFKYAAFLWFFPLLFIYSPILMIDGFNSEVLLVMVSSFLAAIPYAGALSGFLLNRCGTWERLALGASAALLLWPGLLTNVPGFIILVLVGLVQFRRRAAEKRADLPARAYKDVSSHPAKTN